MKVYATPIDIDRALEAVNRKFGGNVTYKRYDTKSNHVEITLTVLHSAGPGGRLGQNLTKTGNHPHIAAACWHVHGTFFDALPRGAKIVSAGVTQHAGDAWRDWNIGSQVNPFYYSEACDCR